MEIVEQRSHLSRSTWCRQHRRDLQHLDFVWLEREVFALRHLIAFDDVMALDLNAYRMRRKKSVGLDAGFSRPIPNRLGWSPVRFSVVRTVLCTYRMRGYPDGAGRRRENNQ